MCVRILDPGMICNRVLSSDMTALGVPRSAGAARLFMEYMHHEETLWVCFVTRCAN